MLFNKISFFALTISSLLTVDAASTKTFGEEQFVFSACKPLDDRAERIRASFNHTYSGYKKYAYGHDELLPVSNRFSDSRNGWGATIVDALDTMILMGFEDYYKDALEFVSKIDFSTSNELSKGFETNIRYLGGLLAANDLRPHPILVQKAVEVAKYTLLPLFVDTTTPQGTQVKVPYTNMNLKRKTPEVTNHINLAEFGTYSMEFTKLSQVTNDPKYESLVNDLTNAAIQQPTRIPGLFPTTWTVKPFAPVNSSTITMGGGGDSFYEYLIKNYLLQNKENEDLLKVWEDTVENTEKYMLSPTAENPNIKFVAQIGNDTVYYSSQELICFFPGNILLGLTQVNDEKRGKFKRFADEFFSSCIETWLKTETGIAPESWSWNPQNDELEKKLNKVFDNTLTTSEAVKKMNSNRSKNAKRRALQSFSISNGIYDLRPETIESIFYYYRLTGDKKYQDLAWRFYLSIEKYAKHGSGYTIINNVNQVPVSVQDFQESFFFAETLKYLYLIFVDKECVSLNNYVFNTEAHPFKLSEPIQYQ